MILGLRIEDPLTRKAVPDWQLISQIRSCAAIGPIGIVARPFRAGFDYRQVFVKPFASAPAGQ
jgi:hypothetical protein